MSTNANNLQLFGVEENNLKNLSLEIPHDNLIVVTGLSGSGKSTLAFDTIYAEGGRRYIETFSPYTRQFLDRLKAPKLSAISGVRPALALEQINRTTSSRSTVGTVTEINDYLKLLWSNLCQIVCPKCQEEIKSDSSFTVLAKIEELLKSINTEKQIYITFSLKLSGKASLDSVIQTLQAEGFTRYFSQQEKTA
ncbi:MAG: hypothetical protein KBC84_08055, partial [Proteobacteria bacterium]|nr:hypothetical protein [Pseudomonadota bacterium]